MRYLYLMYCLRVYVSKDAWVSVCVCIYSQRESYHKRKVEERTGRKGPDDRILQVLHYERAGSTREKHQRQVVGLIELLQLYAHCSIIGNNQTGRVNINIKRFKK